uniref:Serine protease n=1 Tax=Candidatus Kentrum sp. FM TaxID=2126340 RepID=A0A450VN65_9GAMM|nr:MAG: Trypsin-like peptidase domain-containing protein [Candidatus Kentron sp. FM]VFJ44372.1 MAG: Trypsin-like peptidase domain-containing protein [Candidatus Kentron sp. FM]VFK06244.1 MAG: Trypsin-like peptidase domain-containing protein [Candidatus Kentron sp. FM]
MFPNKRELSLEISFDRFKKSLAIRDSSKLEKIAAGYNNLQQISWLKEALRRSQSVGRVVTSEGLGTGWLISDELLITNNHVIAQQPNAGTAWIEFNYEVDWQGNVIEVDRYEIADLVKTKIELDYSILTLKGRPSDKYGYTEILDARRPSLNNSATNYPVIIQHPRGGFKQIALTDNRLVTFDDNLIWYTTDTEPGSSGSPVYDQLWRPFALHHAGGPKKLAGGNVVVLNEGVILADIVEDAGDLLGSKDHLKAEVYDLVNSRLFSETSPTLDLDWYMSNPRLHNSIKKDAKGNHEIAPLLAAAAGVAAGAAAAHWGHVTSKEAIQDSISMQLGSDMKVSIDNLSSYTSGTLSEYVFDTLNSTQNLKKLSHIGKKQSYYEVAPLAAAFLAGVAAGAAAYKAGK